MLPVIVNPVHRKLLSLRWVNHYKCRDDVEKIGLVEWRSSTHSLYGRQIE